MHIIRQEGLVSVLLFSIANFISISELNPGSNHAQLFQSHNHARPHGSLLKLLSRRKPTSTNLIGKMEPDVGQIFGEISTTAALEGSMISEENLSVPSFLNIGRQNTECLCSDPSPDAGTVRRSCSATCTTSETHCGRSCARLTTYAAIFSLFSGEQWQWDSTVPVSVVITSKYSQVDGKECKKLESECIVSSALAEASQLAGAAVALSAGIAVGAIGLAATSQKQKYFNTSEVEIETDKQNRIKRSLLVESALKSSIEEQLEVPTFLKMKRQNTECTCEVSIPLWGQQECSTTCLSPEQICGRFCTRTSVFQAVVHLISSTSAVTTRTFLTIDKSDCDKLQVDCIGSSAIVAAAKSGAVSAVVTGALSAAIAAGAVAFALAPTPVKTREINQNETEEYYQEQNIPFYGKLIDIRKNRIFSRKRRRSIESQPVGFLKSLIRKLTSWLIVLDGSTQSKKSKSETLSKSRLNKHENINDLSAPLVESSITPSIDDSLDKPKYLNLQRQSSLSLCSCADPNPSLTTQESAYYGRICSTTCTTVKTLCNGQICTRTTTFTALFTRFLGLETLDGTSNLISATVTKKFEQIDETSCAILESECAVSSALAEARKSGAIAVGAAVALSAGIGIGSIALAMAVGMKSKENNQTEEYQPTPEYYQARRNKRKIKSTYDLLQNYVDVTRHHPEELSRSNSKVTLTGWLQQLMNRMFWKPKNNLKHHTRTSTELNERIELPYIEGSINLEFQQSPLGFRRQDAGFTCVSASGDCTTTCLSSEILCGGYCTHTSIFENCVYLNSTQAVNPPPFPSSSPAPSDVDDDGRDIGRSIYVSNEKDCEKQEANCMASAAIVAAGRSGEIAAGVSGALSAGMAIIAAVGKCSPRLCRDDRRVFVGRTGLCHDINDPNECQGGRRLYTTAYGDSICDCPVGQYPFPNNTLDDCVSLFTQGPCPDKQVVTISQGGRLFCGPAECQSFKSPMQQLVPTEKGDCYALGSQGFCANNSQVLGYDIFKRQLHIEQSYRKLPLKTIEEVEDLECLLDAANQKNREYFKKELIGNCYRPFDMSNFKILKLMLDTTISSDLRDKFCYKRASDKKPHVFRYLNLYDVIIESITSCCGSMTPTEVENVFINWFMT
ncbi:hypothetical protein DAPPUDRAFT_334841 [Daphnia pulex]|uniref:DUF4789 domain-containing protein n=1 Tax=Daphnia pulex TaxID=6669 RepID=E9HWI5_DAPPU|nr:hypothetical protein DAPPUDRAFT_334841 [Daphnia pulex]|eukprot:EFX63899.1 hypothetical protein DAPPUDRAFT_334841 [Daphnia pulex]